MPSRVSNKRDNIRFCPEKTDILYDIDEGDIEENEMSSQEDRKASSETCERVTKYIILN